jgi:hypothetical protein
MADALRTVQAAASWTDEDHRNADLARQRAATLRRPAA